MKEFNIKTSSRIEMKNIDTIVMEAIKASEIYDGLCVIFVPHTTAAVTINENADPAVRHDIITRLNKLIPHRDDYTHMEGNSDAHIKASLVGSSETIIVKSGQPQLGTWQSVFFCEFDGPRNRKLWIEVK